jgi:hypothetical protein
VKIITHREDHQAEYFHLEYEWADCPGAGFGFDCDQAGNVDESALNPDALANLLACRAGTLRGIAIIPKGVRRYLSRWTEPAVGQCDHCGRPVELEGFTCSCCCGADYNSSGQRLAPRECWGEETGEHPADIARIP